MWYIVVICYHFNPNRCVNTEYQSQNNSEVKWANLKNINENAIEAFLPWKEKNRNILQDCVKENDAFSRE